MLAEMARQILDPRPQRREAANARRAWIAAGLGQMLGQELFRILIAPVPDELGEPIAHVRRKPERVADRAVGRRAAPLDQDVVSAAVLDDVPDDQEIAREVEPADQLELVRDLTARARGERALVAVARPRAALG